MNSEKERYADKRKHKRYDVELGTFAVFRKDMNVLPGLIVDISMGGLAFFYHEDEDWPLNMNELYTLFGDRYNVENVSLKTIYDSEVVNKNHPIYMFLSAQKESPTKIRRRGVKFGTLSDEQKYNLEELINEFQAAHENHRVTV